MNLFIYLAHKWYYSLSAVLFSFYYSLLKEALPVMQFIGLFLGAVLTALTIYGKVLEIKRQGKEF